MRSRKRRPRLRRGVTMVELMVALMIVSIGLLALASGATLLTRLMGGGAVQTRAAMSANSRMEALRAIPCGSVTSGADTVRGIVSRWTTQSVMFASARRGMSINLVVQYPTSRGVRTQDYRTIFPC